MKGRKRQPNALKIARGNPGKRALAAEPPKLKGAPEPPPHLDDEARAEWFRLCADLDEMNMMSREYRPALAVYCVAWSRWVDACVRYKGMGPIIKTSHDNLIQNPLLGVIRRGGDDLRKWLAEFGLTPSSKSRVNAMDAGVKGGSLAGWKAKRSG